MFIRESKDRNWCKFSQIIPTKYPKMTSLPVIKCLRVAAGGGVVHTGVPFHTAAITVSAYRKRLKGKHLNLAGTEIAPKELKK